MHKVINNFAQAARKGCQNILAWLCSDLARLPPLAPLLHRQSAGPEPRMHLRAGSPHPPAAQPAPQAAASARAAPLRSPPSVWMGNPEVHPARRRGDKKSGHFPLAWVVFGGATSPVAPPAIWTASASSVIIQYCLPGRQKTSFSKGQLCTLSLQMRVAHTSDPGGFSRGDQDTCFLTREYLAVCSAASDGRLESQHGVCRIGMNCQCHMWQHRNQSNASSGAPWCY